MAIAWRSVSTYDSVDLTTISTTAPRLQFWLVSGLDDGLDIRGRDTVIPGTAGRTARNRLRDRRVIEIEGFVAGVGATDAIQTDDFRDAMEAMRTLFLPTRSAANLVVLLEDLVRSATISCRPLPTMQIRYVSSVAASMSIELEAIGSDWALTP